MIGSIIGVLTVIASYALKFVGFPAQIRKMKKHNSTKGLSPILIFLSMFSYILWTLHGILKEDIVLISGQSVGIFMTGYILYEYRKINRNS